MGQLTCDDFYSGQRGELWTTNQLPKFYVILEYGDGYIPGVDDFAAYVDDEEVPIKVESDDKVSFLPVKPLSPGFHHVSIIFWPPESYPQSKVLTFSVDTEPAKVTAMLYSEEEGFYIFFFDKVLNESIAESKNSWQVPGYDEGLMEIELINGGISTILRFSSDSKDGMNSASKIDFMFNGSRGLSDYSYEKSPSKSGDRHGQAPPPDCDCDAEIHYRDDHSYDESEDNAYCYEVVFPSSNTCDTRIEWEIRVKEPILNADPWDYPDLLEDPYDFDIVTTTYGGVGPLQEGYHTLKFTKDANHTFMAEVRSDCIPEDEPGGEGYETFKKFLICSFTDADTEPPDFKEGTPLLLNGPDAADKIESIIDEYDNEAFGEAHYIGGRESFMAGVELLRDDPCKLVIVAFAKDYHNLRGYNGQYSPFALEYKIEEEVGMGTMGVAYMVRFDEKETAPNERIPWSDPGYPYYGEYKNDGRPFNEWELTYWILNAHFGSDLSGLEDADFLRVRIEDHAMDNGHGNWRRSQDFLPDVTPPQILGIKAYQQFQDKYVEADYDEGPTFVRSGSGAATINFAVAVEWAVRPPELLEVTATNSYLNEPHLPVGCDRSCTFNAYRLEDQESDEYGKLRDLFFGRGSTESTTYCIDFYKRGSGLTYQGEPYYAPPFVVSDDALTHGGYSPVLYMSHRDHMLDEVYRDDYSVAIACGDHLGEGNMFYYGDARRGSYGPKSFGKLNVIEDVRLGGIGRLILSTSGFEFHSAVQSEGDLFVIDAHGGPPTPPIIFSSYFCDFHERLLDGSPNKSCDEFATPYSLTNFHGDTDWLVNLACHQMNPDSIIDYYDELIVTNRLIDVGGYRDLSTTTCNAKVSSGFNQILNHFQDYQNDLWGDTPGGGKFIAAWMESHGQLASKYKWLAKSAIRARAIDINYLYWIETIPADETFWGLKSIPETYKIRKVGMF